MSLFVTGDTHGGFQRFTTKNFLQQKGVGRDDYMIICGDHGGVWAGEQADGHHLNWLEDKPFTIPGRIKKRNRGGNAPVLRMEDRMKKKSISCKY